MIVGDSLTLGIPGASYAAVLKKTFPDCRFIVSGQGSDTLAGAARRARAILAKSATDVLVFEIGANDLLLPYLASRAGLWRMWVQLAESRGSLPTLEPQDFMALYARTIEQARGHEVAQVVVTTIPCLGEDLASPLNRRREAFNAQIRALVEDEKVYLADVGGVFEDFLKNAADPAPYLLSYYSQVICDPLVTRVGRWADHLSRRRELRLTIDGVHLNRLGARLMAQTIAQQIRLHEPQPVQRRQE